MNFIRKILLCKLFAICLFSCKSNMQTTDLESGWAEMKELLKNIQSPVFPDNQFCITDFGAVGGEHCGDAFNNAIASCHEAGGGRVVVPADTFITGAIHLLSNVNLHLEDGAVILFSTDPEDYLPVVLTRSEGLGLYNYSPLIYAYKQHNIAITGKGILDGQASKENWWTWRGREQFGWKPGMPSGHDPGSFPRLFELSEKGVPVEQRVFGKGAYLRPSFIQPYECKNVLIEDVTIKNPPMWMIHPVLTENITIRNVKMFSIGAPNGDGCDPESCKNVLIEGCEFNTGDDCIALKSGRNRQGYELGIPTENVIIRNCKMKDGHGGITIGSELSGGIRNIYAENCEMDSPKLKRAIRLKSNKYRAGVVENIYVRNIKVGQVGETVLKINQNYQEKSDVVYSPERFTVFRNIFVENLTCDKAPYAIQILGTKEEPIQNVKIINSTFNHVENVNLIEGVDGLVMENIKIFKE
jgi:polygalacturonase